MKTLLGGLVFVFLISTGFAAGIREGMSRAEVEAELGTPTSWLTGGEKTILTYPNRGRVELIGDKVTGMSHVRRHDDPATAQEIAADKAKAALAARQIEEAKAAKEEAAAEAEWAAADAEHQKQFESAVEQLVHDRESQDVGTLANDFGLVEAPSHFWIGLAVALLVQV